MEQSEHKSMAEILLFVQNRPSPSRSGGRIYPETAKQPNDLTIELENALSVFFKVQEKKQLFYI